MANQVPLPFPEDPVAYMDQSDNKRKIKEGLTRSTINPAMNEQDWLNKTAEQRAVSRDTLLGTIERRVSPFVFPVGVDERRDFFNKEIDIPPAVPEKAEGKRPSGGGQKYKYNNRTYTVRTGPRGGKYIVCKNKKVYI